MVPFFKRFVINDKNAMEETRDAEMEAAFLLQPYTYDEMWDGMDLENSEADRLIFCEVTGRPLPGTEGNLNYSIEFSD